MANKISEDTQVQLDLKTIGIIVTGAVSIASVYFALQSDIELAKQLPEPEIKKSEYELEVKNFEVEVGPIKYIAALIYGDEAKNYLDNTVRYVILLLIFVFDPLAVLLLISANMSYRKELELYEPKKKEFVETKEELPVEVEVEEKGIPVNDSNWTTILGKTVRSATVNRGVKKVTKEKDGVKIHFYEEDDGKG